MRTAATALAFWLIPAAAHACSSCSYGQGGPNVYLFVTLLMLLAPMALLGGGAFWLISSAKPDGGEPHPEDLITDT